MLFLQSWAPRLSNLLRFSSNDKNDFCLKRFNLFQVSRNGALKVLDHALIGPEGKDCCNKFVEILGLRTIFPLVSNSM